MPALRLDLLLEGDLDETTWTESYRGGWQTVLPNAGNACDATATIRLPRQRLDRLLDGLRDDCGLDAPDLERPRPRVEKRVALEGGAVAIRYRITSPTSAPSLVALEHVSVGLELLDPWCIASRRPWPTS